MLRDSVIDRRQVPTFDGGSTRPPLLCPDLRLRFTLRDGLAGRHLLHARHPPIITPGHFSGAHYTPINKACRGILLSLARMTTRQSTGIDRSTLGQPAAALVTPPVRCSIVDGQQRLSSQRVRFRRRPAVCRPTAGAAGRRHFEVRIPYDACHGDTDAEEFLHRHFVSED